MGEAVIFYRESHRNEEDEVRSTRLVEVKNVDLIKISRMNDLFKKSI